MKFLFINGNNFQARRTGGAKDEYRKFSVDPNITSFEVLQSILCRFVFVIVMFV